jgi:hypothetical protein
MTQQNDSTARLVQPLSTGSAVAYAAGAGACSGPQPPIGSWRTPIETAGRQHGWSWAWLTRRRTFAAPSGSACSAERMQWHNDWARRSASAPGVITQLAAVGVTVEPNFLDLVRARFLWNVPYLKRI